MFQKSISISQRLSDTTVYVCKYKVLARNSGHGSSTLQCPCPFYLIWTLGREGQSTSADRNFYQAFPTPHPHPVLSVLFCRPTTLSFYSTTCPPPLCRVWLRSSGYNHLTVAFCPSSEEALLSFPRQLRVGEGVGGGWLGAEDPFIRGSESERFLLNIPFFKGKFSRTNRLNLARIIQRRRR